MAGSIAEELDAFVKEVRSSGEPLPAQLQRIADTVRTRVPVFAEQVDAFVDRLQRAGAGDGAPQVGDAMPGFLLPDQDGRLVALEDLLERGPVAIAFVRGHWCPYCRLNANDLALASAESNPLQLVLISPETQQFIRELHAESGADFPFLSDFGNGYALSLNLAIWVDDAMSKLIAGAGWDVPRFQGTPGWVLPIPSVFVVDREGVIVARHVDPDYRRRFDFRAVLPELRAKL
jgi:peroxiredoxin